MDRVLVSVVIVNWKSKKYLGKLLTSLKKQPYRPLEILVVNNSPQESVSLEKFISSKIKGRIITPEDNLGFAGGNNEAIRQASGEFVFLLNPDTAVRRNTLQILVNSLEEKQGYGAVLPKILRMDDPEYIDRVWDGYSRMGLALTTGFREKNEGQYSQGREVFGFQGAAVLFRKSFFDRVGLFDEDLFAYYEDVDLNLRARLMGERFYFEPRAVVFHLGQGASGSRYNSTTVYWSARNKLLVYVKNMPSWLILKHGWRFLLLLLATTIYHTFWTRNFRAIWGGYLHGLWNLPVFWRKRIDQEQKQYVATSEFEKWLLEAERLHRNSRLRRLGKPVPEISQGQILEGELVQEPAFEKVELDVDQDDAWLFEDIERDLVKREEVKERTLVAKGLFLGIMSIGLGVGSFVVVHMKFWRQLVIGRLDHLNCDLYDSCVAGVTWKQGVPFVFVKEVATEQTTEKGSTYLEYHWDFSGQIMVYDMLIFVGGAFLVVLFFRYFVPRFLQFD